jgi:hypothetical protein
VPIGEGLLCQSKQRHLIQLGVAKKHVIGLGQARVHQADDSRTHHGQNLHDSTPYLNVVDETQCVAVRKNCGLSTLLTLCIANLGVQVPLHKIQDKIKAYLSPTLMALT